MGDLPPTEMYLILAYVEKYDEKSRPYIDTFRNLINTNRNISRGMSDVEYNAYEFCRYILSVFADNSKMFFQACRVYKNCDRTLFQRFLVSSRLYTPTLQFKGKCDAD